MIKIFSSKDPKVFHSLTTSEEIGQSLQRKALAWILPIDFSVTQCIRAFSTAILPGQFDNLSSLQKETARRVGQVALAIISSPLSLTAYAVGLGLEMLSGLFHQRPYYYLEGKADEKKERSSFEVFSANMCMLPYGISYFAGVRHPSDRIEQAAEAIKQVDADFVFLQEMATPYALALWDKISTSYAHGFTRIGPMPSNRMEGGLFFASKYPIEQVEYVPLSNEGPIQRGAFCVKTKAGWMINTHLRQGKEFEVLRQVEMQEISDLCEKLSLGGEIPCTVFLDSNIIKEESGKDEYSKCKPLQNFIDGLSTQDPTCTNLLSFSIKGEKDPVSIYEAFEWIDHAFVYKPSSEKISLKTTLVPAYDLNRREEALSDHHILHTKLELH